MTPKKKTVTPSKVQHNLSEKKIIREASYSYVFSWSWFIGGGVFLALFASVLFGLRTLQVSRMSGQMVAMADTLQQGGNIRDAIDVLGAYLSVRRNHPDVWRKQCDLWKALMDNNGFQSVAQMRRAVESMKDATGYLEDTREVQEHILNLEYAVATGYDPTMLTDTLIDARQLLQKYPDHPEAMRILALGSFDQLRRTGSPTVNFQDFMIDQLLTKALELSPESIELAVALADLVIDAPQFQSDRYIGTSLLNKSADARKAEAIGYVDTMVEKNRENELAYLERFRFRQRHGLLDGEQTALDPDLQTALRIAPESERALLAAGRFLRGRVRYFRGKGESDLAHDAFNRAEELLTKMRDLRPRDESGYLALGELYFGEKMYDTAIATWESGRRNSRGTNPELSAPLCMAYLHEKEYKKAEALIDELEAYYRNIGSRLESRHELNLRVMYRLLRSKYYLALRDDCLRERESLEGQIDEARLSETSDVVSLEERLQKSREQAVHWRNQARDQLRYVLGTLTDVDTDFSGTSSISNLEGEAYLDMGRLEAEFGAWDDAVRYFESAAKFPQYAPLAIRLTYQAYRQLNRNDAAMNVLREGVKRFPQSGELRAVYTENYFTREIRKPPREIDFDALEKELNTLAELKGSLQQPWLSDLLQIQFHYVKAGGTRIAQEAAMTSLQELEQKTEYADDPRFFSEIAGQYSNMGALGDFNRVTAHLKSLPGGVVPYYIERIKDAERRMNVQQALEFAREAAAQVPEADRRFFRDLAARIENPDAQDDPTRRYGELLGDYENDMIFDPRTFFELADLALDRGEIDLARNIEGRLRKLEGDGGTLWKFVSARTFVKQSGGDPDSAFLGRARELQQEITRTRPTWDKGFTLLAEIEKESQNTRGAIAAYQMAVELGNSETAVYQDLISLLYSDNRAEEAERVRQDALVKFGRRFQSGNRVLPEPYQGYYEQVYQALQEGNVETAERLAATCLQRAVEKNEPSDRLGELNMAIGKLFFDSENYAGAERYLEALAERGGQFVHALAVCYAKMGRTDDAFEVYLRELQADVDVPAIIQYVIVLASGVRPSEGVWEKIDSQLDRLQPVLIREMSTCMLAATYWTMREKSYNAIPYYRAALAIDPNRWEILNNLALILAEMSEGEPLPMATGRFLPDVPKRIPIADPTLKNELIIRFPDGSTVPRAGDFKFFAIP